MSKHSNRSPKFPANKEPETTATAYEAIRPVDCQAAAHTTAH